MSDEWEIENERWSKMTKSYTNDFEPKETVKEILKLNCFDWPERGLKKTTLEKFGVKCLKSQADNTISKIYYPYHDQNGKITGYKVKDQTKSKKEKGHIYTIGYVGIDCMLFGQKTCRKNAKYIFNCEGEEDALSAYQALSEWQNKNGREEFKSLTPCVTSIGCGTVHAKEHIANNLNFINNYKEIRLCYDNDRLSDIDKQKKNPGMKGYEATQDVGNFLLDHNVRYVAWPDDINDCSDYLQQGRSYDLAKQLLFETKEHRTAKIVGLYDVFKEGELRKSLDRGIYLDSFPKLMDRLLGIRMREVTLMLAPSGCGKSSVSAEIGYNFAEKCGGVGGIFLEEGMQKTCDRFIARKLKIHPNIYKYDKEKIPYNDFLNAEKWVGDTNNFLFVDHNGPIPIDKLIDIARVLVYKHHRKLIVLDHISLCVQDNGVIDERIELERAMVKITALAAQSDVHIIVIAHINRASSTISGSDRDIDKPKWKRTFSTDGKGTQALEGLADNIIPIDIELLPNNQRGRIRLVLGKNRGADNLGFCDVTKMNDTTGIFYDASEEIWIPENNLVSY